MELVWSFASSHDLIIDSNKGAEARGIVEIDDFGQESAWQLAFYPAVLTPQHRAAMRNGGWRAV